MYNADETIFWICEGLRMRLYGEAGVRWQKISWAFDRQTITAVFQTIGTLGLLARTQSLFTFGAPAVLYPRSRMAS